MQEIDFLIFSIIKTQLVYNKVIIKCYIPDFNLTQIQF